MKRKMLWRLLVSLFAVILVATVCTESDSDDEAAETTTEEDAAEPEATEEPEEAATDEPEEAATEEPEATEEPTEEPTEEASALGTPNPATGEPVKIGLINTEGGTAIDITEAREAAEAAVAYANEYLGGLASHEIELVTCFEAGDATTATACANELVQEDVEAVVVTVSGQGDAMVPIITGAGIPYITASGGSQAELVGENVYLWTGGIVGVLGAWAQYAADNDIADVTVFTIDVPTATLAVDIIGRPAFDAAGVGVELAPIPPGTADATPQVNAALSEDPAAVAIVGDATFCTSVLSALQTAAVEQPVFVISTCVDETVAEGAPGALDGALAFENGVVVPNDEESELYEAIMAEYTPDSATDGIAQTGYQSMMGFIRAVNTVGTDGPPISETIVVAITTAADVTTPLGGGGVFTCDGMAVPSLVNLCSVNVLVREIEGDTPGDTFVLVNPASLFAE